jgi:hypothetical protein
VCVFKQLILVEYMIVGRFIKQKRWFGFTQLI